MTNLGVGDQFAGARVQRQHYWQLAGDLRLGSVDGCSALLRAISQAVGADDFLAKPFALEELEARLMARLGAPKETVAAARTDAAAAPAQASANDNKTGRVAVLGANGTSLTVATDFDTAWRRVGLALDRSGFTVENRDRKLGVYEVRLSDTDPQAKKPGFLARLFGAQPGGLLGQLDLQRLHGLHGLLLAVAELLEIHGQLLACRELAAPGAQLLTEPAVRLYEEPDPAEQASWDSAIMTATGA